MTDFKNEQDLQGESEIHSGINDCAVQDLFIEHIKEKHIPVTVFLMCGVRLQGIVTSYDRYTLLLKREGHTQLVFKHSISTIMPSEPIQFTADEGQDSVK